MGGTIYHAKTFVQRPYIGLDKKPHFELEPLDGEREGYGVRATA